MEKNRETCRPPDQDLVLQWGNRKRMRCVKVQVNSGMEVKVKRTAFRVDRRLIRAEKEKEAPQTANCVKHILNRASNSQPEEGVKSMAAECIRVVNNSGHSSPEKSARIHTRGYNNNGNANNNNNFNGCSLTEEPNKILIEAETMHEKVSNLEVFVWPKVVIALSSKEKEEDFMAIKGSKLPQRPRKRAKFIQRNLLVVSPGSWLCDLSQERYEVREKKNTKTRPRGLKAMGSMESDSD